MGQSPPSHRAPLRRGIALILLIALGLRLGWAVSRPGDDASLSALPDQLEYLSLARNLLGGTGLQFLDKRFADTVYAFRTPGYPLFVAACGGNLRAVRVVQALLGALTVLAVYLLARRLCHPSLQASLPAFAAVLAAVNPYLIYFTGLILSETLFTAMLVWGMFLLIRHDTSGKSAFRWISGGLILALSILVRPSAVALPVLLGIAAAFVNHPPRPTYEQTTTWSNRWRLPVGATMLLLTVLALLPWASRNATVLQHWVWLDTNGGFTLYDGYNPDATGGSDQSWVSREPELRILSEVQRSEYLRQKAIWYARSHRVRSVQLIGARLARTWSPVPLSSEYAQTRHRVIGLCYAVPFDILLLVGLIWGRLPRPAKVFLLVPAIYLSAVHALTVGSLRYRLPADGPMAVIAASLVGAFGVTDDTFRRTRPTL